MRFQGQIYNEFRETWLRWHGYVSILFHNFPIILVRRWEWLESEQTTWSVIILGFDLHSY